jgi:hypothetical protein
VIPVSTALRAAAAALLALAAAPSTAPAEGWLRPVPGEVTRDFSYTRAAPFAAGAHRGVDLAAPPGAAVRAACGGRVVQAGTVAGGPAVVSVGCGERRVSHLPLASVAVRAGTRIRAGATIGTLAAGHGGLHVGVRREGDPFGYEDPAAFLPAARPVPPLGPRRVRPRGRAPRGERPRTTPVRSRRLPLPRALPAARPVAVPAFSPLTVGSLPGGAPPATAAPPATPPWAAWAGLALLLTGATGSGTVVAVGRRRSRRRALARRAAAA